MGHKINPNVARLGILRSSNSTWFEQRSNFAKTLESDFYVRDTIRKKFPKSSIGKIAIERTGRRVNVKICTAKPGIFIGRKGEKITQLRKEFTKVLNFDTHVAVEEIRRPELWAVLVAENIAEQLESRAMFRRVMKRAMNSVMRQKSVQGVKVAVAGRLSGAEIARTEWYKEGRVPLHTFRADIDYSSVTAKTTYGIIGVKVWIFKGEVFANKNNNNNKNKKVVVEE